MKPNSKWLIRITALIVVFCFPVLAHAQVDPGDCPTCPIDGGLSILIATGVGYGIKKVKDSRKKKEPETTV